VSEQTPFSNDSNFRTEPKVTSSNEGRFFIVFLSVAVIGWFLGFGSFQLNEMKIKNEIKAAEVRAQEEKAERLDALTSEFLSSKYSKFENTSGDFRYYFVTGSDCKTSRSCALPVFLSKYNCESVDFEFKFTKKSGDIVSTVFVTEKFVNSLDPFEVYFDSTNDKSTDYVDLVSATCNGESY